MSLNMLIETPGASTTPARIASGWIKKSDLTDEGRGVVGPDSMVIGIK